MKYINKRHARDSWRIKGEKAVLGTDAGYW